MHRASGRMAWMFECWTGVGHSLGKWAATTSLWEDSHWIVLTLIGTPSIILR